MNRCPRCRAIRLWEQMPEYRWRVHCTSDDCWWPIIVHTPQTKNPAWRESP